MRRIRLLICGLFLFAPAASAQDASVVLDDFSHPGWGGRWLTLEFSKFTPPELRAGAAGPDQTPSGAVAIPSGGRILLTTAQEVEVFNGSQGKPTWVIPGTPRSLSLAVQVQGEHPVDVTFLVRGRQGGPIRTEPQTVRPGGWTTVSAKLPSLELPVSLFGIELRRQGLDDRDAQLVMIDDLRATVDRASILGRDNAPRPLLLHVGRAEYDASPVPNRPLSFMVRAQILDVAARELHLWASITHEGRGAVQQNWAWSATTGQWVNGSIDQVSPLIVATAPDRAVVREISFVPSRPGAYTLSVYASTSADPVAPREVATMRVGVLATSLTADTLIEDMQPHQQRIDAAVAPRTQAFAAVTNLSPAMVVRSATPQFKLFDGINVGQGLELPRYVAVPQQGGVRVYRTDQPVSLAGMTESWLVFFAGDARGWDQIRVTSRNRNIPTPFDLPWLVVLQRKPTQLSRTETGLVLDFPAASAQPAPAARGGRGAARGPAAPAPSTGYVALMPLHGLRMLLPAQTVRWATEGFPAAEAAHASTWARRLKRFPLHVKEDYKVDPAADVVTIRQQFIYLDMPDEWATPLEKFAPVAPMLAFARHNKMPIHFFSMDGREQPITDGNVATGVGPASGIAGTDDYYYEIRGTLKYINEDRQPVLSGGGAWGDRLRELIRTKTPATNADPLFAEPDTSLSRWEPGNAVREDYGIAMVGNSERQGLLGSTIPYVDRDEAVWRSRTLMLDALYMLNTNNTHPMVDERTGRVHVMEGMAWTRFRNWVDNNAYAADMLRALDYYARYTGDNELIRRHWPLIRSLFTTVSDFKRHGEWELAGFHAGGGDTWDSTYNGVVGFARMADRIGDAESYRYACYYHAKHLATLPGQRAVNDYVDGIPYWASVLADVTFTPDRRIASYQIDVLKWTQPAATIRDLVFSDVWGQNYGLRGWNQTVFMRGARSEYRAAADLVPDYARYWLDERVKNFAPEWHQAVLVERKAPPADAIDRRTGAPVRSSEGDYAGHVTLGARAIILGEKIDDLWAIFQLKTQGVRVLGTDGRVPRPATLVTLLEDGTHQPWVRLYGNSPAQISPAWERGHDAYLDLGEENYMYGLESRAAGFRPFWAVFTAPEGRGNMQFGHFGPAGSSLEGVRSNGVSWNTTIVTASLGAAPPAAGGEVPRTSPEPQR